MGIGRNSGIQEGGLCYNKGGWCVLGSCFIYGGHSVTVSVPRSFVSVRLETTMRIGVSTVIVWNTSGYIQT